VGVVEHGSPLTPGVRLVLDRFLARLEEAGAQLVPVSIGSLDEATDACFRILAVETADRHEHWLATQADDYTPYVRERIREGFDITGVEYLRALATCTRVREGCDAALAEAEILVLPAMPFPAPVAYVDTVTVEGVELPRDYAMCRNTAFANDSGHPALTIPAGFEDGLPIGVQLVAAHHADARLLEVGETVTDWELAVRP
jgi:aspartyl-tRNA(Asn)/glutamyl-tRNA(Gln) amidotransferase subunit A